MTELPGDDRLRCRLALGGTEDVVPAEFWRMCRTLGGDLYAAFLRQGELVPVDTPFGPRLAVTSRLLDAAERAIARSAPAPTEAPPADTAAAPTLLHDLLTLAAFITREQPRVTGRGQLAAPALRRLEGLGLTPEGVVPALDRRALAGTRVWQFLFRFLCMQDLVRLDGGRANPTRDDVAVAAAQQTAPLAGLLFTFAAARLPVGDSAWLAALAGDLPAAWERRQLVAWLGELGVHTPDAALERAGGLLEALGFARLTSARLVLLPPALALGAPGLRARPGLFGPSRSFGPVAFSLPGGGVAVDVAAGDQALIARLALDRQTAPETVGHMLIYGAELPAVQAEGGARVGVRIAAVVRGPDDALIAAAAESIGEPLLARWPGGFAVEVLCLEDTIARLERLGARVQREAPWQAASGGVSSAALSIRPPALPWTLARAREGAWSTDGAGAFRPMRSPAALSPAAAQALPTVSARLRAAAAIGWPVSLRVDASEGARRAVIAGVRWEGGEERVEALWLDGRAEATTIGLSAVRDATLLDVPDEAAHERA